jgi:hypothetical protein
VKSSYSAAMDIAAALTATKHMHAKPPLFLCASVMSCVQDTPAVKSSCSAAVWVPAALPTTKQTHATAPSCFCVHL